MPAYNFLARFAEPVESGRKRQTIRPKRKRPTKPGDTLYLYTGMRTKQCRKLREADCLSVQPIEIDYTFIKVGGRALNLVEKLDLIQADGFGGLRQFYKFFEERYGIPHEVDLELIKW